VSGDPTKPGWASIRFDELDSIPVLDGLVWHPIRRRLGIGAFGVNAYTSDTVGGHVIEDHDELGGGAGGHEELYVVVRGRATFTVGSETQDAPAGTLVFVSDPTLRRHAVAEEEGTLVLAIGGEPGRAYEVSPWESYFAATPLLRAERWDEAIALIEKGLRDRPGHPALLYNLACAESRGGRTLAALTHLQEAVRGDEKYALHARTDPDFDPIRNEPGFPSYFPPADASTLPTASCGASSL
jgi:tetratricopeptide (TPR) repeat protein